MDKIEMNGYWYEYKYKLAKDRFDICLATKDPQKYCNSYYRYSRKDPGSGMEYVVLDSNDPEVKILMIEQELTTNKE